MGDGNNNGWGEWKNHVLAKLQEQGDKIDQLEDKVTQLLIRLEGQSRETGVKFGILAAVAAVLLSGVVSYLVSSLS